MAKPLSHPRREMAQHPLRHKRGAWQTVAGSARSKHGRSTGDLFNQNAVGFTRHDLTTEIPTRREIHVIRGDLTELQPCIL